MDRPFVICLIVLVVSSPIHGWLGGLGAMTGFGGMGMGGMGGGAGGAGSPMTAYMGFQMCSPVYRSRNNQGGPGGPGGPGMRGPPPGRPGGPGAPGGPGVSQRANPASFLMGMAVDVPDAPDMFGCFCQNFGNECWGFGVMGTDPRCSRFGLCCSCDGWF